MKLIGVPGEKVRTAMMKDYADIEKFYLKYNPNKGWCLFGVSGKTIVTLGEITNITKLRIMIEDVPIVLEEDGFVIKHYKVTDRRKWAVFHHGSNYPIVSNMRLDWAIDYVARKLKKSTCFCLC